MSVLPTAPTRADSPDRPACVNDIRAGRCALFVGAVSPGWDAQSERIIEAKLPWFARFDLVPMKFLAALTLLAGAAVAQTPAPLRIPLQAAYDSWMLATAGRVPGPEELQTPAGFSVEVLRVATPEEDSWVGVTFDDRGRLVVAKEKQGLLRFTFDSARVGKVETIDDTLLECRGLLWAHGSLYANANNSKTLYRLRDTDGDDRFDEVRPIFHTEGGVGHGRNHLRLGPDDAIYAVHGDDPGPADAQLAPESPYRNWGEHRLVPGRRPAGRTNVSRTGHVLRISADGTRVERIAGGLRNPLDLDFNRDGEMFVYDADMERDIGLAWYRPTRVLHIVSGGEYGWRHELSWALGAEDNLPAALDIGLGSPTGVTFGYRAAFPAKYREAFFIADWAYGRIIAVHLRPEGASYRGESETFLAGRPLNVTDLLIGPDGAMYFVTGGRRTQSALYRVRYNGAESTAPAPPAEPDETKAARALRHELEKLHAGPVAGGIEKAFAHLAHADRWVRFAARIALEAQLFGEWRERALQSDTPGAWLAVARVGEIEDEFALLRRLATMRAQSLDAPNRRQYLRAIELALVRLGAVDKTIGAELESALRRAIAPAFPSGERETDRELCRLLVWLHDDSVLAKTLALLTPDRPHDDTSFLLFMLCNVKRGWDAAGWRTAFEALRRAEAFPGANLYVELLKRIRNDLAVALGDDDKRALGDLLAPAAPPAPPPVAPARFVHAWKPLDFRDALREPLGARDFAAGRDAFGQAGCAACHRVAGNAATQQSVLGPDLTAVGARFGPDALLLHIVEPSLVIDDKYRQPDAPNISPMPPALLNGLEREQVLDLLAYLSAGGDASSALFGAPK